MTNSPELRILDVGHGNSAVVIAGRNGVVDAPRSTILQDTLRELRVDVLHAVLISHSDADHVAGIVDLLLDTTVRVENLYVNSDGTKDNDSWTRLKRAMSDARLRAQTRFVVSLTSDFPGTISLGGDVELEVLSPASAEAVGGPGTSDLCGRKLDANDTSAVIRVLHRGEPRALLAGDMGRGTLERLRQSGTSVKAPILVFPHHGGRPGTADAAAFTADLLELVQPDVVIFSIGRGRHGTPRPEIVEQIRRRGGCDVACTQLSGRCALNVPNVPDDRLDPMPAAGRNANSCCAGSLAFPLDRSLAGHQTLAAHRVFVESSVPHPLCRGAVAP